MQIILLYDLVAVNITDQRLESSEVKSSRTKRLFLHSPQQSQIKSSFDVATHLFDNMDKLDFGGFTGELIGSISSFLGAVDFLIGFFLGLFSGLSPEYQLLKSVHGSRKQIRSGRHTIRSTSSTG